MPHNVMRASHARSRTIPITYSSFSTTFGESKPGARCAPIRKQAFRNSGFRDVADPRYHGYDFLRQTTISHDLLCSMVAQKPADSEARAILIGSLPREAGYSRHDQFRHLRRSNLGQTASTDEISRTL